VAAASRVGPITNAAERFAQGWIAVAVIAAWGFGEAIILPIVPDVLLYILVVAAPRRAALLFGWTLLGALLGSLALSAVTLAQPTNGRNIVLSVPGITEQTLQSAETAVRSGDPLAMVHLGPGIPLKVYTVAWWEGSGTPAGYVAGVVANRVVRIGAGVLVFALIGALFPGFVRRRERLALLAYVVFWIVILILAGQIEGSAA
jgi:membrane protein YqaA with SNARE-associated domain